MRIIAVPLARHRGNASLPYITYLARSAAQKALMENKSVPVASESWSQRAMVRASEIWTSFGRTDVQSAFNWKRRLFTIGESIMDRIEYEEWALKSIDQVLGPTIRDLMISSHKREKQPEKVRSTIMLIPDFPSLPPQGFCLEIWSSRRFSGSLRTASRTTTATFCTMLWAFQSLHPCFCCQ